MARDNIRNFCIIAHIDHGKSTLSDRILELTKSVDERTMEDQILDNMDIERERGITIKARAVTMNYTAKDGKTYEFNLIDTPGHVDFAYEVSRSLAACEGAILVVDATQGVEAQTLANTYMALEHDLELVPILNKIDLPSAHPDEVAQEVEDVIGLPCLDAPRVSAKTGLNVDQVLERVVTDIPAPTGDPDAPLKALIFDSIYDSYKGVIVYIRVFEGTVKPGDTIRMMAIVHPFVLFKMPVSNIRELDLSVDELKKIRDVKLFKSVHIMARDIFMLTYYLGGINLRDLMEYDFTKGNCMRYIRHKTRNSKKNENEIAFTIQPEAQTIIERYISENGKLVFGKYESYEKVYSLVFRHIGKVTDLAGINRKVSYYSARKTFAQHGYDIGIEIEKIEYCIGHSMKNNRPIFNYIRIMQEHADKVFREIFDQLLK